MNVSDIIHSNHQKSQQDRRLNTQRYSDPFPRRLYESKPEDMANALTATQFRNQSPAFSRPYPPPSPPLDDLQSLRTLPSIHSLMNMDGPRRGDQARGILEIELYYSFLY